MLLAFERPALAYTDPGTGALIWQMFAAAFVGAAFYFRRFLTWFTGRRARPPRNGDQKSEKALPNRDDRRS